MKNLFRLFQANKSNEQEIEVIDGQYPQIVQDIHNEFMIAGDRLLKEAQDNLNECNEKDIKKGESLIKIGFKSAPQTKEVQGIKNKIAINNDLATTIQNHKMYYPNNKFISAEDVKRICEKYSLIKGCIDRYNGFVPSKNLSEIEVFEGKHAYKSGMKRFHIIEIEYKHERVDRDGIKKIKAYLEENDHQVVAKYQSEAKNFLALRIGRYDSNNSTSIEIKTQERPIYEICAPLKNMISDADLKFAKTKYTAIKHVPDPIVLMPVEMGYIIVTAWGDEANDPLVLNQDMK